MFTVGPFQTLGHPELFVLGLPPQVAVGVLSIVVDAARSGQPLDLVLSTDLLLEGYESRFRKVPASQYPALVGRSRWYYQSDDVPLYQFVRPTRDATFPRRTDASPDFRHAQPVIAMSSEDASRSARCVARDRRLDALTHTKRRVEASRPGSRVPRGEAVVGTPGRRRTCGAIARSAGLLDSMIRPRTPTRRS